MFVYLFGHGGGEQEGASLSGNHLQDFIHLAKARKLRVRRFMIFVAMTFSAQVIMFLHIKYREHYKMMMGETVALKESNDISNSEFLTTHLSLKVHVEDSVCFVHDQELQGS